LERLGIDQPTSWRALADPRLRGLVSLVNPAQSGSVTTAFETLLGRLGWDRGWQVLRRAAANARTISASALRGPMDVAAGDAAMGVCIDFFGRGESQALIDHGDPDRIRYIDPAGETTIDPDPISMLADPPDPELARRSIEFTLSDAAQGLWQLPPGVEGGPQEFALRRIPITGSAWARDGSRYIDQDARPGVIDAPSFADRSTRAFIAPLLSAMALDERRALETAWDRIVAHHAYPDTTAVVTAGDVDDPELKAMLQAFDAMPDVTGPDGIVLSLDSLTDRQAIKGGWLREGWAEEGLWHSEQRGVDAFRQHAGAFFRQQYGRVEDGGGS
jgi:spermidine/putrescine-binding protein